MFLRLEQMSDVTLKFDLKAVVKMINSQNCHIILRYALLESSSYFGEMLSIKMYEICITKLPMLPVIL